MLWQDTAWIVEAPTGLAQVPLQSYSVRDCGRGRWSHTASRRQGPLAGAQGRLTSANVGDSGFVVVGATPYRAALQVGPVPPPSARHLGMYAVCTYGDQSGDGVAQKGAPLLFTCWAALLLASTARWFP